MNTSKLKVFANYGVEKLKKNSHKILVGVGIVSGGVAIYSAIKATMEVEPIIDAHKEHVDTLKEYKIDGSDCEGNEYTDKDYSKDLVKTYLRTAGYFAKLYWKTAVFEGISIASTCTGLGIIDKKYTTTAALFASTFTEFSEYRSRVAEKYGEEAEYDIYTNTVEDTIETKDENGKKKKEKVKVTKNDSGDFVFFIGKDYCKFWDDRNTDEQNIADAKVRISGAISNSNRQVKNDKGYCYLSDIADRLGVAPREAYRRVAIKYNPDFGEEQISTATNVKIRDNHLTEGGEKIITVEIKGLVPFNIDEWDPIDDFLKLKVNN